MPRRRSDDFDTALTHARAAIKLMVQHGVPPTPARFAVVYAHQTGDTPDLSLAINRLVAHDKLTAAGLDDIHSQFFATPPDAAGLTDVAGRLERTLGGAVADTEAAAAAAARLQDAAEAAQLGRSGPDRLAALAEDLRRLAGQWGQRVDFALRQVGLLRRDLEHHRHAAGLDRLTGMANRPSFDGAVRDAIVRADTDGAPLALLMIDIDHFTRFNDQHGHPMGDQVLKLVARSLAQCRGDGDVAARYGGEEFTLLLPRATLEAGLQRAERLRGFVGAKRVVHRKSGADLGQITLSIGAAAYRPGESAAALIHRADEALYLAKDQGRNRVASELDLPAR